MNPPHTQPAAPSLRARAADRLIRLFHAAVARRSRWQERARRRVWSLQPGVHVSCQAFVAPTAKLELDPEGIWQGGSIQVGAHARLAEGVLLTPWGGSIVLAENVSVGPYSVLCGQGGLTVGRDTMIAGHTYIIPGNHGFADRDRTIFSQPSTHLGITIGEDVWIGCGVRILDGVTIGRGCVIAAGAVVTRSLPDYAIAVGVPARVVGERGGKA